MQIRQSIIAGLALGLCASFASAQDIKIAHVYDKTGPLEAYAKQTQHRPDAWGWSTPPTAR